MSPIRREREYAKRRYVKWQGKRVARQARKARQRRLVISVVASLAVVGLVVGVFLLVARNGSSGNAAADGSSSPSASAPSTAGASPSASPAGDNPCPVPTVTAPASPKTWPSPPPKSDAGTGVTNLVLTTTCGDVTLALDGAKAPQAVASTLFLADNGFYDGTPCHRLTTQGIYVLQCGDPTGTGGGGPGFSYGPVENAPKNNIYPAGTVAMARQGNNGSSMGSQFFLVYKDSPIPADSAGGYTVMGKIIGGLAVVEKVAAGGASGGGDGPPVRAISIVSTAVAK